MLMQLSCERGSERDERRAVDPPIPAEGEPWDTGLPQDYSTMEWRIVEETSFAQVPEQLEPEALRKLERDRFIPIDGAEAKRLTLGKLAAAGPFFLLRGVAVNEGKGNFSVQYSGATVVVHHGSLGHAGLSHRRAIVAALPVTPTRVLVTATGAL